MNHKITEAGAVKAAERDAQTPEHLTPEERLLLNFYRQLSEADQAYMRRAIQAMSMHRSPG